MAGLIKNALVRFPQESKTNAYICHVNSIRDFYPKHAKDFDASTVYQVKWEKSDLAGNHNGLYSADVLLLGGELVISSQRERLWYGC